MPQLDINNMTFESLLSIDNIDKDIIYESEYPELDLLEAINECADIECEIYKLENAETMLEGAKLVKKAQLESSEITQEEYNNYLLTYEKNNIWDKFSMAMFNFFDKIVEMVKRAYNFILRVFKVNEKYWEKHEEEIKNNFDKIKDQYIDVPFALNAILGDYTLDGKIGCMNMNTGLWKAGLETPDEVVERLKEKGIIDNTDEKLDYNSGINIDNRKIVNLFDNYLSIKHVFTKCNKYIKLHLDTVKQVSKQYMSVAKTISDEEEKKKIKKVCHIFKRYATIVCRTLSLSPSLCLRVMKACVKGKTDSSK